MSSRAITPPFPVFTDTDGSPLGSGYIYVGAENLDPVTNPIPIYWDEALTIPALQPVSILNGYPSRAGSPAQFFANSDYSILAKNSSGVTVYTCATSPSAPVDVLSLLGDSSDVDLGDALLVVKSTATGAVPRTQHSKNADSLNARDFGIIGDGLSHPLSGVTSWGGQSTAGWSLAQWQAVMPCVISLSNEMDWAALQSAINAAIVSGKKLRIPAPSTYYKIDQPLLCAKWSGTAFSYFNVDIEGEVESWDYNSDFAVGRSSVIIRPTFNDKFALGIQNGRAVSIKNICLVGNNSITLTAPDYAEMMTNSNFVTGGCRDQRYSPYSGICIDPFGTSVPADGGYPGMSSYYVASAAGSSGLRFEGVKATNFVAGCIISPNGTTQNAEDIEFSLCGLNYNKVGLAICQSQSRDVNWRGGEIAFNLFCCDGLSYGLRQGFAPNIFGITMAGKYLFNVATGYGAMAFHNIYAEAFASIGFFGTATSTPKPVSFIGCDFYFHHFGGLSADWHLYTESQLFFEGCQFTSNSSYTTPLRCYLGSTLVASFRNCGFQVAGSAVKTFLFAPASGGAGLSQNSFEFYECTVRDDSSVGPNHGKSIIGRSRKVYNLNYANNDLTLGGTEFMLASGTNPGLKYFASAVDNFISLGSLAITVAAAGAVTFTATDGAIIAPGDIIYNATSTYYEVESAGTRATAWNAVGYVVSVTGNDVVLSGAPQSLISGTYALYAVSWKRFHEPSTCTTNSSTSLTLVSPVGAWKNGQHIRGTGIPAGAYIVSGGGTATLTISKAATASAAGVRIYDADVYSLTGSAV